MANGRVAQRQTVRTTRTATTVWIGPTAARAASFWSSLRGCFAVVLWRHSPTYYMPLSGQREGSSRRAPQKIFLPARTVRAWRWLSAPR